MSQIYPAALMRLELIVDENQAADAQITPARFFAPPARVRLVRNDHQTADTFEADVDLEDFPFDPRIIRGGSCEVYIADAGAIQPGFWQELPVEQLRAACVFSGVIDEWRSSFDDDGRRISLKGRDYTAYFLDAELPAGDLEWSRGGRPREIAEILEDIVGQRATTKNLRVVKDSDIGNVFPARYKARATEKTGKRNTKKGETAWDVIQEVLLEAGLIGYFRLNELRVRRPRNIYLGDQLRNAFHFTLGRDISSFELERSFGRQHGINVVVTSWDPDAQKALRAFSPKDGGEEAKPEVIPGEEVGVEGPGVTQTKRLLMRPYTVRGITDQDQLQEIADSIREQLRHHEARGKITTSEMRTTDGRPVQLIGFGDPLVVDLAEAIQSVLVKTAAEQIDALARLGYKPADARKLIAALDNLRTPFFVKTVTYTYSSEDDRGFELEIEFQGRKTVELSGGGTQALEIQAE